VAASSWLISASRLRYSGVRTTPHLFRDAVAFKWLKEHPKDYLTLSKMLWHKNVQTTIQIYGAKFNESSGVCAIEAWIGQREAKEMADLRGLSRHPPATKTMNRRIGQENYVY
jgi:integrase